MLNTPVNSALNSPYIPSISSIMIRNNDPLLKQANIKLNSLPNMTLQASNHEHENLKLHLCNGVFEAYSASFLTTKAHILGVKSEKYNLTWVNCEMASFTHMRDSPLFYSHAKAWGMVIQTLDVLDFSVIHLSAFERSSKKYKHKLWKNRKEQNSNWSIIDEIKKTGQILEQLNNPLKSLHNITYSIESQKTVVIMPFLGGAMGAGHSELGNRFVATPPLTRLGLYLVFKCLRLLFGG